jgi:hypothetical protein
MPVKSPNNENPRGQLKESRKKRATLLTDGDLRRYVLTIYIDTSIVIPLPYQ